MGHNVLSSDLHPLFSVWPSLDLSFADSCKLCMLVYASIPVLLVIYGGWSSRYEAHLAFSSINTSSFTRETYMLAPAHYAAPILQERPLSVPPTFPLAGHIA